MTTRLLAAGLAALIPCAAEAAVRPAAAAERAMVVASDPAAARAALSILETGGNAVDAAVAAGFALAVTHPQAGNVGGGGFMLVRLASGRTFVMDYRETAPAAARREMFLGPDGNVVAGLSTETALAAGVPGTVAGLALALEEAGSLPLARVLAPAIRLAEEGFPVPEGLARAVEAAAGRLEKSAAAAAVFLPEGRPVRPGAILVQRDLARTLRAIAEGGPRTFYDGPVAEALADFVKAQGGLISRDDLRAYRAVLREPVRFTYRGHEILSAPPPSAGGVVLGEMLHMLEPFDIRALGPGSSAYWHLLAEVMKRAYADRAAFLGDPDFAPIPAAGLLSPDYARGLMKTFDPRRATPARAAGPGEPPRLEGASTTHFTIADEAGNVVANTYTLNDAFGSGILVEGLGFLLNNEMDDFTARPGAPNLYGLVQGKANAVGPGKRMLSSMTPTIVLRDGRPFLALGTPGGGRITTIVLQVILNAVEFGMELQAAVDAPRCHHQWLPDRLTCEAGAAPADVAGALRARGHDLAEQGLRGDVQAILFDREAGLLRGASDARGYGAALGR
jgi:gamma-glutamyltranspeptidase/glutathione hydrolase